MYTKVFGHQTTTDILPGQNVPHLTGEMMILVPKNNKYPFLSKNFFFENFTQYSHNSYEVFGKHFLKDAKQSNLCCQSSGHY